MQASATAFPVSSPTTLDRWIGRTHLHPLIDYLLVGGGLTIPIFIAIYFFPSLTAVSAQVSLKTFLIFNGAHFAASAVRLYTKQGAKEEFPFLSWGFPIVCLVALAVGLSWPALGRTMTNLYLSWSPYHYAAQTYGLAVMYAMRSGARLGARDKSQIWWVCLLPFLYAFFTAPEGGLAWFVSKETLASIPVLDAAYQLHPERFVQVTYADPDSTLRYCANSELADLALEVYRRDGSAWRRCRMSWPWPQRRTSAAPPASPATRRTC